MTWKACWDGGNRFVEAARKQPGWYWMLRPRSLGRRRYDPDSGVMCLVHMDGRGKLLSPLADLRDADLDGLTCRDDHDSVRYGTWFLGPITPGTVTGAVRARRAEDGVTPQVTGDMPAVPGWHWCRTNAEAPLLLVDADAIGPVYLEHDADGVIRVFLAADTAGNSVDVGEFGFSEPLVSEGGVIDESGELGRVEAEFFGAIKRPGDVPRTFPRIG